jgi:3D (Asp-Asp-Asp) domain-containing protein
VGLAAVLAVVAVPVAVGAESAPSLRSQAQQLQARSSVLESRAATATQQLYALETKLARARAEVRQLRERRAALRREQASARRLTQVTADVLAVSQERLSELVRALYEQGNTANDPLAILLGAGSLEAAITGLDSLSRAADVNQDVVEQAREARAGLAKLRARLAGHAGELDGLLARAERSAAELEGASAARAAYIERLRRERQLSAAEVARVEAQARQASRATVALQPSAPEVASIATPSAAIATTPAPAAPERAPASDGSRTLTVEATGYSLPGRTASGLPVGWGIVAVDPSVIPLGTRLTIPGYGEAVAADTGGAVHGNVIDLWFPTTAQALAWGRRVVTIAVH